MQPCTQFKLMLSLSTESVISHHLRALGTCCSNKMEEKEKKTLKNKKTEYSDVLL